jgi:hypothetical protein
MLETSDIKINHKWSFIAAEIEKLMSISAALPGYETVEASELKG